MATGGDEYPLPLYEASSDTLTTWNYRGTIFDRNAECPNFFHLDDRWVFITSAYADGAQYHTGSFDHETLTFTPTAYGHLDRGYQLAGSKSLYGTNVLFPGNGECLLFGRLNGFDGFSAGNGWNGCMANPRILSIDSRGLIVQRPARGIMSLRGKVVYEGSLTLSGTRRTVCSRAPSLLEIRLTGEFERAKNVCLDLHCGKNPENPFSVIFSSDTFSIDGHEYKLQSCRSDGSIDLQLFLDRSVIEVFIGAGQETLSHVFEPGNACEGIELWATGGDAKIHVEICEMSGIAS